MVTPLSHIESFKAQSATGETGDNKSTTGPLNMTTGTGDNKSTTGPLNMTTGTGEYQGSSNPTGPTFKALPQNNEPERLVPNPSAFELAKNESNSENPPDKLISSLKNKSVLEPPIISSPD